jgi:hypothetical protein
VLDIYSLQTRRVPGGLPLELVLPMAKSCPSARPASRRERKMRKRAWFPGRAPFSCTLPLAL